MKTRFFLIALFFMVAMLACNKEQVPQQTLPEHIRSLAELNMKLQSLKSNDFAHIRFAARAP